MHTVEVRESESAATRAPDLPELTVAQRIALRICLSIITRIEQTVERERAIRHHTNQRAAERRAEEAQRLALLTVPRR